MAAFLTLKLPAAGGGLMGPEHGEPIPAAGQALTRQEYEYPIPADDAEALLERCDHRLGKIRFGLDLPGGDWVLDVFEGANAPLVVAEVELERADQPVAVPPGAPWRSPAAVSSAMPPWHTVPWRCGRRPTGRPCWSRPTEDPTEDPTGAAQPGPVPASGGRAQQLNPSRQILP